MHHDDGHGHDGGEEIHIRFSPLESNPNGPVTAYRVVVLDETEPSVFDQDNLGGWEHSQSEGVPYWIAAEIGKTISTVRKA